MSRQDRLYMVEALAGEDFAECPDCHDFAHPSATSCESCGARLFPKVANPPTKQVTA